MTMCPQNHSLNAGVWNTIEQQCRNWAKQYGKVYIVCGPIFLNKEHRKLGKNKVVVPDAFFKVVLHTGKNPQAIGFICRNQSQKGRKKTEFVNQWMKWSVSPAMISSLSFRMMLRRG